MAKKPVKKAAAKPAAKKKANGMLIAFGIVSIILGLILLSAPIATTFAVDILLGAVLVLAGIVQFVASFWAEGWWRKIGGMIVGIIGVFIGLFIIGNPLASMVVITLVIAFILLLSGAFRIGWAFHERPRKGWGEILIVGILSVILSLIIISGWPLASLYVVGILLAIDFIATGLLEVVMGYRGRK